MAKKIIGIIFMLLCTFCMISCNDKKVESISVVNESIADSFTVENVETEILKLQLLVVYNNKEEEKVNVTKEMIDSADYEALKTSGTHQVKITYLNFTTSVNIEVKNNNYSVEVKYTNGSVVTGVAVQWCSATNCFLPVVVNDKGYAEKDLEDGNYFVHLEGLPEGYTYDPNAYVATKENKHLTIYIEPICVLTGSGTKQNPYEIALGMYEVTFEGAGVVNSKYFSYKAEKSGEVTIASLATEVLAVNEIDPYLGFIGTTNDLENYNLGLADVSGNIESNINFTYKFTVEAGKTYYFLVLVSKATSFPATFTISLK